MGLYAFSAQVVRRYKSVPYNGKAALSVETLIWCQIETTNFKMWYFRQILLVGFMISSSSQRDDYQLRRNVSCRNVPPQIMWHCVDQPLVPSLTPLLQFLYRTCWNHEKYYFRLTCHDQEQQMKNAGDLAKLFWYLFSLSTVFTAKDYYAKG